MGAIFGLVSLDGRPVVRENLERMSAALAAHGPDGNGIWLGDFAGFGHHLMCFTPEDRFERQPLKASDSPHVLAFDGRIDNRPELMEALGISHLESSEMPDSAFVLRAYGKWAEDCVHHLVGSYVFAICDLRRHRVLLVRSPTGQHCLFYHSTPGLIAFSTAPKGLFALPFVRRELDLQNLGDYLIRAPGEAGASMYGGISRVPAGHSVTIEGGGIGVREYWSAVPKSELRLRRDSDYVDAFTVLFERVAADNLRSIAPVGVMMSGGLDSSSVAAVAAAQLAASGARLATFTEVPREGFSGELSADRYADETPFVQAMARKYPNIDLNLVRTRGRFFLDDIDRSFDASEATFPNATNRTWMDTAYREAAARGVRVLLTGAWGNLTISWNGSGLLPGLVRRGRWKRAFHEARAIAGRKGAGHSALRLLAGIGLLPLLPAPIGLAVERYVRGIRPCFTRERWQTTTAMNPEFAQSQGLAKRFREKGWDCYDRMIMWDARRKPFQPLHTDLSTDYERGQEAIFGIQTRDPTYDARIVQFCRSVPEEQFLRNGESRWLIRRAMTGRLPDEIVGNRIRGLQAADWFVDLANARERIARELASLRTSPLAARILDLDRVTALAERMPSGSVVESAVRREYRLVFSGALMTGRFLTWFEAGTR